MKKSIEKILSKLQPLLDGLRRYLITLFMVGFLSIYSLLLFRIHTLTNREPDPATLSQRLQAVKRVSIDQNSIDTILDLEEQNIEVRALFKQARNNPFNE